MLRVFSNIYRMQYVVSCRQIIVVFRFPNGKFKSIWWMPWLLRSDEGRGVATICFGEVPSNL